MADAAKIEARRARLLERFRTLSHERLERLNRTLVALENRSADRPSADPESAEETSRELHTLKGEAKLLGFTTLSTLAHATEDFFERLRGVRFQVDKPSFDAVLAAFDLLDALVDTDPGEDTELEGRAGRAAEELAGLEFVAVDARPKPSPTTQQPTERRRRRAERTQVALYQIDRLTEIVGSLVEDHAQRGRRHREMLRLADAWHRALESRDLLFADGRSFPAALRDQLRTGIDQETALLAELRATLRRQDDAAFEESLRLERLEDGLQEVRLQPLGSLFGALPRAARDLAHELGKEVALELEGESIAVDQRVLEALREPLLHLLRNAVDHGIEAPEARRDAGKPTAGRLHLVAAQEGASAVITLRDDGAGIDLAKVRERAIGLGLTTTEAAAERSPRQVYEWLFRPGFSTRERATEISGRGIGMDVVRTGVEALGGTIDVDSTVGRGTTFRLQVPISSAFERVLVIEENGVRYALPSASVERLVQIDSAALLRLGGGIAFHLGDEILPMVDLAEVVESSADDAQSRSAVVVLGRGLRRFGLRVEILIGERSLVRKPPDPFLGERPLILGTAQVEGRPVLVLSVHALLAFVHRAPRPASARAASADAASDDTASGDLASRILLVDDSELTRSVLAEIVRGRGLQVIEAGHGREALEILAAEIPDLVLLDLDMPMMNGFELLKVLRGREATRDLPVVVFSSRGSDEDKTRCAQLGADAYLVKSTFQEADLLQTIERFLAANRPEPSEPS